MQCLIVLTTFTAAVLASDLIETSDDANNVAALEKIVQNQAASLQSLEARLAAQDAKILQQTVSIHNLQAELATQQNTIDTLLSNSQSSKGDNQSLAHRLDMLEQVQIQQAASVQNQQALLQQHASVQEKQEASLRSFGARLGKQEQSAGFYADFGYRPYHIAMFEKNATIKFPRVLTNIGNNYDNTTGVFTAPYSGLYAFHLHFLGGDHNGGTELAIFIGDHEFAVASAEGSARGSNDQGSCTAVAHLTKGDAVSVGWRYGTPRIWGSRLTSFTGMLVHSD